MVPHETVEDHVRGKMRHKLKRGQSLRIKRQRLRLKPKNRIAKADRTRKYGRGREDHKRAMSVQAKIEARELEAAMDEIIPIGFGMRTI